MQERQRVVSAREVLAENMRGLREARSLSQEALAAHSGLHRTYVSQVERCKVNVSLDNVQRIADALGVPLHKLLDERKWSAQSKN
jgi:transcriptional regulator with XRE-family HTH domain